MKMYFVTVGGNDYRLWTGSADTAIHWKIFIFSCISCCFHQKLLISALNSLECIKVFAKLAICGSLAWELHAMASGFMARLQYVFETFIQKMTTSKNLASGMTVFIFSNMPSFQVRFYLFCRKSWSISVFKKKKITALYFVCSRVHSRYSVIEHLWA